MKKPLALRWRRWCFDVRWHWRESSARDRWGMGMSSVMGVIAGGFGLAAMHRALDLKFDPTPSGMDHPVFWMCFFLGVFAVMAYCAALLGNVCHLLYRRSQGHAEAYKQTWARDAAQWMSRHQGRRLDQALPPVAAPSSPRRRL